MRVCTAHPVLLKNRLGLVEEGKAKGTLCSSILPHPMGIWPMLQAKDEYASVQLAMNHQRCSQVLDTIKSEELHLHPIAVIRNSRKGVSNLVEKKAAAGWRSPTKGEAVLRTGL